MLKTQLFIVANGSASPAEQHIDLVVYALLQKYLMEIFSRENKKKIFNISIFFTAQCNITGNFHFICFSLNLLLVLWIVCFFQVEFILFPIMLIFYYYGQHGNTEVSLFKVCDSLI